MVFSHGMLVVLSLLGCIAITGCSETPSNAPDVSAVRQAFPVLWLGPNQLECHGDYKAKDFRLTPEESQEMAVLIRSVLTDSGAKPSVQPASKEDAESQIVFRGRNEFAKEKAVFGLYERYKSIQLQEGSTIAISEEVMTRVVALMKNSSAKGQPPTPKEGPPPPSPPTNP